MNSTAAKAAQPTPSAKAALAPLRNASASPRPTARPARTVAALDSPSGTMNEIEASCSAIPCAASATVPRRPTRIEEKANRPTSASTVSATCTPIAATSRSASQSARHSLWNSRWLGNWRVA